MTNISTHQQSRELISYPARSLSLLLTLPRYLFRSRRTAQIDFRYASEHLLKDIGLSRSHDVPPLPSHARLW